MNERQQSRRRARELVLQSLYASESGNELPSLKIFEELLEKEKLNARNAQFATELYAAVTEHSSWADRQITDLAENWRIERIAAVDRIILRMGLVELQYRPDVPPKVVLNEAIELARTFFNGRVIRVCQRHTRPLFPADGRVSQELNGRSSCWTWS